MSKITLNDMWAKFAEVGQLAEAEGWAVVGASDAKRLIFSTGELRYVGSDEQFFGAAIVFILSTRHGRFEVFGNWPQAETGDIFRPVQEPNITVSAVRSAKAIWCDIKRRFLPKYLKRYTELRKRAEEYTVRMKREREIMESLGARVVGDQGVWNYGRFFANFYIRHDEVVITRACVPISDFERLIRGLRQKHEEK